MNVTLVQAEAAVGNKEANIGKMAKYIAESESDLVVFGEMFLTGYACRDDFRRFAEPLDGPSVESVSKLAVKHGCCVVFGMPERSTDVRGLVYNSAVLAHPDGRVDAYRKAFLPNFGPFEEKLYFAPGSQFPVFPTKVGRIGLLICYELFFPEISKLYALSGADILCSISASPTTSRPYFEKIMPARAVENTAFFLYTNLVGVEGNMLFWGGNTAISPRGDIIAKGDYMKEQAVSFEIDLREIKPARDMRPTIADTKAAVFQRIQEILNHRKDVTGYDARAEDGNRA